MPNINKLIGSELCFFPELGYGHYPVPQDRPYDSSYFEKYRKMAATEMGHKITQARVEIVLRHHSGSICDVGIGSGQFVETCNRSCGYDVNPSGIEWLNSVGKFHDIYEKEIEAISFWDVLEHIDDPERIVKQAKEWVFVSVPIFDNAEHIIKSRHYRKDEHIHYWTHQGFINWFTCNGFQCIEFNTIESNLGREGISTYAFKRNE